MEAEIIEKPYSKPAEAPTFWLILVGDSPLKIVII